MGRFSRLSGRAPALFKWGKLLGMTGGAQLLIQAAGFVTGIFIIRILSTEQYAYYTLVNTMLGTMTVLADGGISTGVMSEGGKQWKDRTELGKILATGMHMRRQFAVFSLLVSLPILYYLLDEQGLVWHQSLLLIACLTPAFWAALSGSLLQIVPKLHQNVSELLKINVRINVIRLLITLPVLFFVPFAGLAILASGVSQVWGNLRFRALAQEQADYREGPSPDYRQRIMRSVKKILPGSIYYCVSGQINIWLIAIFGSTESVAQIGALSRLVVVLSLVRITVEMVIVPRYARLPPHRKTVTIRFFQVLGLVILLSVGIVGAVYLLPDLFLWVLGGNYADLEYELVLIMISSCLGLVSGLAHTLATARGIIPNPYLIIATVVGSQILLLAFVVDYTTLVGVITFGIYVSLVNLAYRVVDFLYRTSYKIDWAAEERA